MPIDCSITSSRSLESVSFISQEFDTQKKKTFKNEIWNHTHTHAKLWTIGHSKSTGQLWISAKWSHSCKMIPISPKDFRCHTFDSNWNRSADFQQSVFDSNKIVYHREYETIVSSLYSQCKKPSKLFSHLPLILSCVYFWRQFGVFCIIRTNRRWFSNCGYKSRRLSRCQQLTRK